MSGAGDFLFGESGSSSEVVDVTPDEFRRLRGPLADELSRLIQSGGGPTFGGPFTAGLSPEEGQLLGNAFGASTRSGLTDRARETMGRTIEGDFLSPESNPFLQETIRAAQRPVIEQFQDVTLPRLRSQFTRAGQSVQARPGPSGEGLSSPFDEAVSRTSRGAMNALSDISTNIASQNFQQERSRQQTAAQNAPAFERAELDRLVQGLQTQALPRLIEQQGIDQGLKEFRRRMNTLLEVLRVGGGLSAPQTAVLPGVQGTSGFLGNVGQGIGQGLGQAGGAAAGAAMSDRRLKSGIREIGRRTDGIGVYFYWLFGAPEVGVLADEVEPVIPEAVGEIDGYATVDYAKVF